MTAANAGAGGIGDAATLPQATTTQTSQATATEENRPPRSLVPLSCPLRGVQLIEASAGTGKTFTITTLYLRLLLGDEGRQPLTVDQILVVTFTRAATAELRDKLRDRVRRAVLAFDRLAAGREVPGCGDETIDGWACARKNDGHDPETDSLSLRAALRAFDEAAIFTIHGFAQRMLADHAFESGVTFDADLVTDESALLREVVEDYWAHATYDAPQVLVRHLSERKIDVERLVRLARHGANVPAKQVIPARGTDEPSWLTTRGTLRERLAELREAWRAALAAAAKIWWSQRAAIHAVLLDARPRMYKKPYTTAWIQNEFGSAMDRVMGDDVAPPLKRTDEHWDRATNAMLDSKTLKGHEPASHAFFDACDALQEAEAALFAALDEESLQLERGILDFARSETDTRKRRWNKQSFDDLLVRLDAAMKAGGADADALVTSIRARFPAALIDEFQDTDPAQWAIFQRVYDPANVKRDDAADAVDGSGDTQAGTVEPAAEPTAEPTLTGVATTEPNASASGDPSVLFLIGDPKQAIYGFRGADIYAYLAARSTLPWEQRWTLAENWRSDPAMIRAVNTVFGRPASPFALASLQFNPVRPQPKAKDRLVGATRERRSALRLLLPQRAEFGVEDGKLLTKTDYADPLRKAVAEDIVRLLQSGMRIEEDADTSAQFGNAGAGRNIVGSDRDEQHGAPDEAEHARPVRPGDIAVLVRSNEDARQMQRALRAAGVPSALQGEASVLDTSDATDVLRLLRAMVNPGDSVALLAALATPLLGLNAHDLDALQSDEERWDAEASRVRSWHDTWVDRGFVQAFRRVLLEAGTAERLLAREDGERRLTNLLHLGEILHTATAELRLGPAALVQWLVLVRDDHRARSELVGEGAQLRLESDAESVRLVTVHKSKGLEYPIVYCPTLCAATSLRGDGKDWPRFHAEETPHDLMLDVGSDAEVREAHQEIAIREELAEDLRVMYVALTRARHQCVVLWGALYAGQDSALAYGLHADGAAADEPAADTASSVSSAWTVVKGRVKALFAEGDEAIEGALAELVTASRFDAAPRADDSRTGSGATDVESATGADTSSGNAASSAVGSLATDTPTHAPAATPAIHISPLSPATGARWSEPDEGPAPTLAARAMERKVQRAWRVASFTSLAAGGHDDASDPVALPGRDRDAVSAAGAEGDTAASAVLRAARPGGLGGLRRPGGLVPRAPETEEAGGFDPNAPRDDDYELVALHDFPAGARAGQLLHDIFENTDFTIGASVDRTSVSRLPVERRTERHRALEVQVQRKLRGHGLHVDTWHERLTHALHKVLHTPLGGEAPKLADVVWDDRIAEMAFMTPLRDGSTTATPSEVADLLAAHGGPGLPAGYADRLRGARWGALRGLLHGYIDLVFRAPPTDGGDDKREWRWYLLDYKSNRLGPTRGDYRPSRVAEEMTRHDYVLQYHLYVLALHRYLTQRLPGYDYERHFGGVRYVFARGMRPEDGASRGVFADRPPAELVHRLDALLLGEDAIAPSRLIGSDERSGPAASRSARPGALR